MSINEDSDIDNKRIVNYIVVAVLVVALLALNWCSLKKYLSSNSGTINDFQISESEMTKTREPAVAGIFYASELRQLDSEVEHYLSAEIGREPQRPEILTCRMPAMSIRAGCRAGLSAAEKLCRQNKKRHPCRSVAPYGFQGHCRSVGR